MASGGEGNRSATESGEDDLSRSTELSPDSSKDGKRKKFRPFKAMKKLFTGGGRKRSKSTPNEQVRIVAVRDTIPDEPQQIVGIQNNDGSSKPLGDRSLSADSLLTQKKEKEREQEIKNLRETASSMQELNQQSMNFQSELFNKLGKQTKINHCEIEDETEYGSNSRFNKTAPAILLTDTSNTTRDFYSRITAPDANDTRVISPQSLDFGTVIPSTSSLSNQGARHKISVRPKSRRLSTQFRGVQKKNAAVLDVVEEATSPTSMEADMGWELVNKGVKDTEDAPDAKIPDEKRDVVLPAKEKEKSDENIPKSAIVHKNSLSPNLPSKFDLGSVKLKSSSLPRDVVKNEPLRENEITKAFGKLKKVDKTSEMGSKTSIENIEIVPPSVKNNDATKQENLGKEDSNNVKSTDNIPELILTLDIETNDCSDSNPYDNVVLDNGQPYVQETRKMSVQDSPRRTRPKTAPRSKTVPTSLSESSEISKAVLHSRSFNTSPQNQPVQRSELEEKLAKLAAKSLSADDVQVIEEKTVEFKKTETNANKGKNMETGDDKPVTPPAILSKSFNKEDKLKALQLSGSSVDDDVSPPKSPVKFAPNKDTEVVMESKHATGIMKSPTKDLIKHQPEAELPSKGMVAPGKSVLSAGEIPKESKAESVNPVSSPKHDKEIVFIENKDAVKDGMKKDTETVPDVGNVAKSAIKTTNASSVSPRPRPAYKPKKIVLDSASDSGVPPWVALAKKRESTVESSTVKDENKPSVTHANDQNAKVDNKTKRSSIADKIASLKANSPADSPKQIPTFPSRNLKSAFIKNESDNKVSDSKRPVLAPTSSIDKAVKDNANGIEKQKTIVIEDAPAMKKTVKPPVPQLSPAKQTKMTIIETSSLKNIKENEKENSNKEVNSNEKISPRKSRVLDMLKNFEIQT